MKLINIYSEDFEMDLKIEEERVDEAVHLIKGYAESISTKGVEENYIDDILSTLEKAGIKYEEVSPEYYECIDFDKHKYEGSFN